MSGSVGAPATTGLLHTLHESGVVLVSLDLREFCEKLVSRQFVLWYGILAEYDRGQAVWSSIEIT